MWAGYRPCIRHTKAPTTCQCHHECCNTHSHKLAIVKAVELSEESREVELALLYIGAKS